ncbi:MAG: hypothetical protein EBY45_05830 [Gammaproteobacteria bacterium]|jgi:hypothetical protein|nr:hypothetical protein [Gammaproteobacteria bacterium]
MEWLSEHYLSVVIAGLLFFIYAKLDELHTAIKDNTNAVNSVEQEVAYLSVERDGYRDLRERHAPHRGAGIDLWA